MNDQPVITPWPELSEREQMSLAWWDTFYEVYGIRPRSINTSHWTVQDFADEIDKLCGYMVDGPAE